MKLAELKKSLTDVSRKGFAERYRIAWIRALPTLFIITFWGASLPWYSVMTCSVLALVAVAALLADLTRPSLQKRTVRSGDPFSHIQFVDDRFDKRISQLRRLPVPDSEKIAFYKITYQQWLNSTEAIEAMILSTTHEYHLKRVQALTVLTPHPGCDNVRRHKRSDFAND